MHSDTALAEEAGERIQQTFALCAFAANKERLAAALSELNARLRGVDADKLGIDPKNPQVLISGATFTMDTDAGPAKVELVKSQAANAKAVRVLKPIEVENMRGARFELISKKLKKVTIQ